mgnify:CR=1 FL=1
MCPVPVMTDVVAATMSCESDASLRHQRALVSCRLELSRQFDTFGGLCRASKSGKVTAMALEKQIFE